MNINSAPIFGGWWLLDLFVGDWNHQPHKSSFADAAAIA
jgi:hypothetical protein